MFFNLILCCLQNLFGAVFEKSFFLGKLDWFIGLCIFAVIISSTFASSDVIGYFALFAIILTFIKLVTKRGEQFEMSLADKFLLVYFLLVVISVAGSSLLSLSLKGAFKTFTYLGFYISLIHYLKDNKHMIKYIFVAYIVCLTAETIAAFIQNFISVGEISGWQDTSRLNPEEVMTRVYGTLKPYNPNLFGGYMLSCIPSVFILPFINKKFSAAAVIFFFAASAALIFTGCRGAYVGYFMQLVILMTVVYCLAKPELKKLVSIFAATVFVIITTALMSLSALRARVFSIFAMRSDSSNSFRFNVYNSCVHMLKDNWLLGIGVGNANFREVYGLYMKTGFDALSAYNIYLEIAVESGIFALISFAAFLGINIYKAFRFIVSEKNINSIYVTAALISVSGMLVHGVVDTVFFRPQIQFVFWTMIAIIRVLTKK